MEEIIKQAVGKAFDIDALGDALAKVVADRIDYEDLAHTLSTWHSVQLIVKEAALEIAEDLL